MIIGANNKFHGTMVGPNPDTTILVTDVYVAHYPRKTDQCETKTMITFTLTQKEPCNPKIQTSFSHTDNLETFLDRIKGFHKIN